jgi:hypothetical protein
MAVAGLVSVLFRYLYAVRISGMVVDEMRYQILSPALIFLMAYVYARLSVFRTLSVFVFFVIVTSVIVILVSLTRSYVISVVFLMVGGSFLTWRLDPRNRWADLFSVRRFLVLTSAVFAGAFGLAAANVIRPDIIESWQARLFADQALTSSGSDVNLVSRIAEASGIWNQTMESPRSAIFGSGFGNLYQWDYTFAGEVSSVSVEMVYAFFAPTWSMAHSPFTYALFFGGAVGLLWQLWFFIYPLAVGVRNLPSFIGSDQREVRFLYVFCMLAIWLCVSQSLTSNPLGERMSAQFLGVVIGLLFGVVARVRNLN